MWPKCMHGASLHLAWNYFLCTQNVWSNTKKKSKQWPPCSLEFHFLHCFGGRYHADFFFGWRSVLIYRKVRFDFEFWVMSTLDVSSWRSRWFESWLHVSDTPRTLLQPLCQCVHQSLEARSPSVGGIGTLSEQGFLNFKNSLTRPLGNTIPSCYFSMCDISDGRWVSLSPVEAPRIQYGNSFISIELLTQCLHQKSFCFPDCFGTQWLIKPALCTSATVVGFFLLLFFGGAFGFDKD